MSVPLAKISIEVLMMITKNFTRYQINYAKIEAPTCTFHQNFSAIYDINLEAKSLFLLCG